MVMEMNGLAQAKARRIIQDRIEAGTLKCTCTEGGEVPEDHIRECRVASEMDIEMDQQLDQLNEEQDEHYD